MTLQEANKAVISERNFRKTESDWNRYCNRRRFHDVIRQLGLAHIDSIAGMAETFLYMSADAIHLYLYNKGYCDD
jgi:hypothetical protein